MLPSNLRSSEEITDYCDQLERFLVSKIDKECVDKFLLKMHAVEYIECLHLLPVYMQAQVQEKLEHFDVSDVLYDALGRVFACTNKPKCTGQAHQEMCLARAIKLALESRFGDNLPTTVGMKFWKGVVGGKYNCDVFNSIDVRRCH